MLSSVLGDVLAVTLDLRLLIVTSLFAEELVKIWVVTAS